MTIRLFSVKIFSQVLKLKEETRRLEQKLQELQSKSADAADVGGNQYHDNSSYEMLVVDLRGIDRRLTDAHHCLNQATVVGQPTNLEKIAIGTCVKIVRDGKELTLEIVGYGESDPNQGLLAYNTPLAALIMGKSKGDIVTGIIAEKEIEIEVIEIMQGGSYEKN